LLSAALSLTAVLSIIYGLKQLAEHGAQTLPVVLIAFGLAVAAAFVYRQNHMKDPQIDLRLFRSRVFSVSLMTYMLGGMVMFGCFIFVGQYLQLVLGLSALEAGLWTIPFALAFVVGSMLTPL